MVSLSSGVNSRFYANAIKDHMKIKCANAIEKEAACSLGEASVQRMDNLQGFYGNGRVKAGRPRGLFGHY